MLIDRVGPVLRRLHLSSFAFQAYEWALRFDPRVRPKREAEDGLPVPPASLLVSVAGTAGVSVHLDSGRLAASSIRDILRGNGTDIGAVGAILDFGCGCGRVLRCWRDLAGVELHGTDYNRASVDWCRGHLPFARCATNELSPPTRYGDGAFGLIYALSVFTHLPEALQHAWMDEFHRLLAPDGLLLLSLHGSHYLPRLNGPERASFLAGKLVTRFDAGAGTNLCCVFHPEAFVRDRLSRGFEIVDFRPEGALGNPRQDAWLLRRG